MPGKPSAKWQARVRWAWWWPYYVATLVAFCRAFDRMPDPDRVRYWARRAVRVTLVAPNAPDTLDA